MSQTAQVSIQRIADVVLMASILALAFALGAGRSERLWPLIALPIVGLTAALHRAYTRRHLKAESEMDSKKGRSAMGLLTVASVATACMGICSAASAWI